MVKKVPPKKGPPKIPPHSPSAPLLTTPSSQTSHSSSLPTPNTSELSMPPSTPAPAPPSENKANQRTKIANEILSTEKYYVECLQTMTQDYMTPLQQSLKNKDKDVTYTENDMKVLFPVNLSMIIPINCELQKNLEEKMSNWDENQTSIGEVFIKVAPFFKMYLDYSNNYGNAMDLFKKLSKDDKFTSKLQSLKENARIKLSLDHLLIMPVQRIPRYILLLTEIVKCTPDTHPDKQVLTKAISMMEGVANHINESMKKIDKYYQAANYPELVLPHRNLLWEGIIENKSEKLKGDFKFILFNDLLVHIPKGAPKFSKAHTLPENQVKIQIVWSGQIITLPSGECLAEFTIPKRTYQISYNTPEEKAFFANLKEAISKVYGDNPPSERRSEHDFGDCIYNGEWKDGFMHGEGEMIYKDICKYTGQWEYNQKSGFGTMVWNTGHSYTGQWKHNLMNGEGEYRWSNGDVYKGTMCDGKKSGKGTLTYGSGGVYTGDWLNDRPSGTGTFTSDQATYIGEWQDGLFHGEGEYDDKLGNKFYKGSWVKGLKEGNGYFKIGENEYTYNGEWKAGKKHGYGTLQIVVNEVVEMYQGYWVNDKKDGQGVYNYFDGSLYEGTWKDDMKHGHGKFTFYENDVAGRKLYEGEFSYDKMCGKGTLYFKNGEKYVGHFKDNQFHGTGRYELNNVIHLEGKWNVGTLEGKGNFLQNIPHKKKPSTKSGSYESGSFFYSSTKFEIPIASGNSIINLPQM